MRHKENPEASVTASRASRTRPEGNAAWRALSETHTRDGRPVEPMSPEAEAAYERAMLPQDVVIAPSPIRRWLAVFLPEVAAGTLDLDELLGVVDEDLAIEPMTCPICGVNLYRRSDGMSWRKGMCVACYLERLRAAHLEKTAVLEAQREVNAAKTQLRRMRDAIDPDRPRRHPAWRECVTCGTRLPPLARHPEDRCAACIEREERRETMQTASEADCDTTCTM